MPVVGAIAAAVCSSKPAHATITIAAITGDKVAGQPIVISGTSQNGGPTVRYCLSGQQTWMPQVGWTYVNVVSGSWSGTATPSNATGQPWFVWAHDPISGERAVVQVSVVAQTTPVSTSLYTDSATPVLSTAGNHGMPGLQFRVTTAGQATGMKFYRAFGEPGAPHSVYLWNQSGTLIASGTSTTGENDVAGTLGWVHVNFTTPAALTVGTTYTVSYFTTVDFPGGPLANGTTLPLNATITGVAAVFNTANSVMPTTVATQDASFYVDILFLPNTLQHGSISNITQSDVNTVGFLGSGFASAPLLGEGISLFINYTGSVTPADTLTATIGGRNAPLADSGTNGVVRVEVPAGVAPGPAQLALTLNGTTTLDSSTFFSYLHIPAYDTPQRTQPGPPSAPASWKGPFTAVNPPRPGQLLTVTMAVNGAGGAPGDFGFLNPSFTTDGQGNFYPLLADGGTIRIPANAAANLSTRAGCVMAGAWASANATFFPGGLNVVGDRPDQSVIAVSPTDSLAGSGKALTVWGCNVYMKNVGLINDGNDQPSGGVGAVRQDHTQAGSAVAHHIHLENCRIDRNPMGNFCAPAGTMNGENFTAYFKNVDFGLTFPNGYPSDFLSHDTYSGAYAIYENCNFYGCQWGANLKGRSPGIIAINCYIRRGANRWLDFPEGGRFESWNTIFDEWQRSVYVAGLGGETDLHAMAYAQILANDPRHYQLSSPLANPYCNNCDFYFGRSTVLSSGSRIGTDFIMGDINNVLGPSTLGPNFVFDNCRTHWSNQNNDPAFLHAYNCQIVGIPTANAGVFTSYPTPPPSASFAGPAVVTPIPPAVTPPPLPPAPS